MVKSFITATAVASCLLGVTSGCLGNEQGAYKLPAPTVSGGMPVMQAIDSRCSIRSFDQAKPIADSVLSDLLWSAWGINRADGRRTVPTALNKQEMQLYVVKPEGVWRYEAKDNALVLVSDKDWRVGQMLKSPLNFVYAGSDSKFTDMHAGSMYQTAGLCAASLGLGNVVIFSPVEQLCKDGFPVDSGYHVVVAQSFGWPAQCKKH